MSKNLTIHIFLPFFTKPIKIVTFSQNIVCKHSISGCTRSIQSFHPISNRYHKHYLKFLLGDSFTYQVIWFLSSSRLFRFLIMLEIQHRFYQDTETHKKVQNTCNSLHPCVTLSGKDFKDVSKLCLARRPFHCVYHHFLNNEVSFLRN
jgi:hypothetical protein